MNEDPPVVASWRGVRPRDVVVTVHPRRAEAFVAHHHHHHQQWMDEVVADDGRIVELLARLDDVATD